MSITYTDISEQDWRDQFQPHTDADGINGLKAYGYQTEAERRFLEQMAGERRLWTYGFTGSGNAWIAQGFAYVNRECYLVCDVPVPEGIEYTVDMGAPSFCEDCGHWFTDESDDEDSVERADVGGDTCVRCLNGEGDDDDDPEA